MSAATTEKPEGSLGTLTAVPIPADLGAALVAAFGREGAERWALETLVLHGMDAAGFTRRRSSRPTKPVSERCSPEMFPDI